MIEKRRRFFRRYELRFAPPRGKGAVLPLVAGEKESSVLGALNLARRAQKASFLQPNGDTIDLIAIDRNDAKGLLTLLFHRASPNAADPSYRKRLKDKITVRQSTKDQDEEQTVSAHLVVQMKPTAAGAYKAALEEMPGLSLSVVRQIIVVALQAYEYSYIDTKGEEQTTYSTFKAFGEKSESLTNSLKKKSSLNALVLTRTTIPDAPDSEGIAEAKVERIRYAIVEDPGSEGFMGKLKAFAVRAREEGWDDVAVELTLDDDRHRTVKLDREEEAAEVLFVRAEQVIVKKDLDPCTMHVIPELVDAAKALMLKA